ncbi:MFS transporter [Claveliimonas bilis]|uniref:MFS transporter n=1 Tax=Claveliimonas bilis TaxID=3028070 RepID=A0ABN6Z0E9_9FIRM|nr:MFS transporter [Claveliimonas bilis]MCQ5202898.1 MFS transporter [Mordavella massiliensis]BCZ26750.1 MFS transporter [Claveliimonas bilis]BDZ76631.1 MFS transporter [Claveliimonas bilis]BDZ79468.1 MFS transporter [Claveliimonas bilis]
MKQKQKYTSLEKAWILYDVGNSAFVLLVSTIIPIYFNYLSESAGLSSVTYLAYWGYAASVATLAVAFIGPVFGAVADTKNYKKKIFLVTVLVGVIGCIAMGIAATWLGFLVIFVIAKIGYSASLVFYDSMLHDVTTPERLDEVSSQGYAWGYIGSCIPFIISLGIVLGAEPLGLSMQTAMGISFAVVAVWWIVSSLPLLKNYRQIHYVENTPGLVGKSFRRLWETLKGMKDDRKILLYLLAYFFYIDGVYTIIEMATAYGTALGLDTTGLLLALLVTQIVAFPSAIAFGKFTEKYPSENLITICILAYTAIAVYALFLNSQLQFWILAVCVGLFQGGIQALSRSHFAKLIPPQKSGEYFGIMDICGKGASFIGTALVGFVSQVTGSTNQGVAVLAVVFVVGLVLFRVSVRIKK